MCCDWIHQFCLLVVLDVRLKELLGDEVVIHTIGLLVLLGSTGVWVKEDEDGKRGSDACESLQWIVQCSLCATSRETEREPVVSKAPVFKLTKRSNTFGLNPKQQQVLNISMCPLAAIKHSKRARRDTFRFSFLSMRARTCAIRFLYGSESDCLGSIKQQQHRSHLRTINRLCGEKKATPMGF